MATATEIRKSTGTANSRGKLPAHIIEDWNTNHPDDPYEPGPPRDGFTGNTPDYPEDDFDQHFPDPEPLGDTGETPPRRPRPKAKAGGIRGLFPTAKKKTAGKRKPRVSTA